MKKRVVVGLSGGVDSSVAAYLLQEAGYEVIGLFMKNWHDESVTLSNECPWVEDSNDAMAVAEMLGIPYQAIDLSKEYKERVVDYMFREYQEGRTPNPDVLCNREIKFDIFLKAAMQLQADFVATGHYCRKEQIEKDGETVYQLKAGIDNNKDQSYFLCQLSQEQLSKALFPIGELTKPQVREIAREIGLATADKKDSQGICFVGKVKLPEFLQQQLKPKNGHIIEIAAEAPLYQTEAPVSDDLISQLEYDSRAHNYTEADGENIGTHMGAHFYTIGQRKGLNIGGKAKPLFVIATDTDTNTIYTGQGSDHPGLYRKGLKIADKEVHWVREDLRLSEGETMRVQARIRYRQALEQASLYCQKGATYLIFDQAQRGIAAGQFAAWYLEDELIGSGTIG